MHFISQEQISGKVLEHLGLVSATIEKLGLCEKIDQLIPVCHEKDANLDILPRLIKKTIDIALFWFSKSK